MAKKRGDGTPQEPDLELPSLFGRGRKRRREQPEESVEGPVEETRPLEPVALDPEPEPEPEPEPVPATEPKRRAAKPAKPPKAPKAAKAARTPKPQRAARTGPVVAAPVAAVLTGLVVGLAGTALTYVSLRGCEMLKGTESCGAPGLGVLAVIVILMVLGGGILLGALKVSDPRGTSFLAVGLMSVVVLVTLMEELFSAWMFVAIPLICAVSYAVAHWVTTRFVETADDRPHVDVR
jgi:hypothetical protein